MISALAERAGSVAVAVAAAIVIVGLSIAVFFNPPFVYFEQDRSGADRLTGYTPAQVHAVTGSILSDLIFGPPRFDATVNGQPVLDSKERQHMVDVRNVFVDLGAIALVAALALVAAFIAARKSRWFWQGLQWGGAALTTGVVVVGAAFVLFFDQAFTLLHDLFFAPGTWTFNGGTERLVQLFPDQFWSETTVLVSLLVLVLALALTFIATRRLNSAWHVAADRVPA